MKRYATGSSLSKKPASATHSPSRNCGPGNGILSGTASMGCTRRECSFIGKMTSRRCSRAQPLNTLLTEKASPLRQSANVIRASSAWARGGGRARARRDQPARPAPLPRHAFQSSTVLYLGVDRLGGSRASFGMGRAIGSICMESDVWRPACRSSSIAQRAVRRAPT